MEKNEMRKSYMTDEWVIIAEGRSKRPKSFEKPKERVKSKKCPFCPGNEKMTVEIESIISKNKWVVRSIKNIFPVVSPAKDIENVPRKPGIKDKPFYSHYPITGYHEVIVETPTHNKEPYEMGTNSMKRVIDMYVSRFKKLSKKKNMEYVAIFKNRGETAGASLSHPHSQITALPTIPQRIEWEMSKKCILCQIIERERESNRFLYENESFIAICPYAPRFQYEVWVIPKKHMKDISKMSEKTKGELAEIMTKILRAMESLMGNFPYNYAFHQAPKGKDFHFHIQIYPRLAKFAGLELGSNIYVNEVSPEYAAELIKERL